MTASEKEDFIRQKAKEHVAVSNEKILWSLHAVKKLRIEKLRKSDVENSLKECIIIEDYLVEGRVLPDCLVFGMAGEDPMHVVAAIDMAFDRIIIVTVYRPSPRRWENGRRRKK